VEQSGALLDFGNRADALQHLENVNLDKTKSKEDGQVFAAVQLARSST
jgi:hypothetical protein